MNTYKFRWSFDFLRWRLVDCIGWLIYPFLVLTGVAILLLFLFILFVMPFISEWTIEGWGGRFLAISFLLILMLIVALIYVYLLREVKKFSDEAKTKFGHIIRYVEVGQKEITLTQLFGCIVLEHIESVEHVTKAAFDSAKYLVPQRQGTGVVMVERYGLSMQMEDFVDPKYGAFTRICNNFFEIAMVTCKDGKKYLINYPSDGTDFRLTGVRI